MTRPETRLPALCALAFGLAPLAWLAGFYAFVLRARLALGYWPRPYMPDPKDLGFIAHHAVLAIGLTLLPALCLGALLLTGSLWRGGQHGRGALAGGIALLSFVLTALIVVVDPGAYISWFVA
jgi:hypothetical protein